MSTYAEMSRRRKQARVLYLKLRALGLKVNAEQDPDSPAGHRVVVEGLRSLNPDHADRLVRLVRYNEAGLVEILRSEWDPDLVAIRQEGSSL
ncbi:MAG: hypothetical protein ACR2JR_11925 [Rubrobacteraceae bacterium]